MSGCIERSQVAVNHQPEATDVDPVVFVPQEVSKAAHLGPSNLVAEFFGHASQFPRRLADDEQRVFDGVPVVNSSMRPMFSKMS